MPLEEVNRRQFTRSAPAFRAIFVSADTGVSKRDPWVLRGHGRRWRAGVVLRLHVVSVSRSQDRGAANGGRLLLRLRPPSVSHGARRSFGTYTGPRVSKYTWYITYIYIILYMDKCCSMVGTMTSAFILMGTYQKHDSCYSIFQRQGHCIDR